MFESHPSRQDESVPGFKSIDSLISKLESASPEGMQEARKWAADALYKNEAFTVRSLRLRAGLSQAELGKRIGSSQPHVARIERGTEDIQLSTFRKLAAALALEPNELDQALRNQEAQAKGGHRD